MGSGLAAGLGFAGSLLGASGSKRASKAEADAVRQGGAVEAAELRALAAPYMEAANYALPQFRNLIMSQYAPQVGEENPFLAARHRMNQESILRREKAALANAAEYWGAMGDLSRGRGEALRIAQNATDAMNQENLGYGGQQQEYRTQSAERLANALSRLNSMASPGVNLMRDAASAQAGGDANAAGIQGAGERAYWNALGSGFGLFGSGSRGQRKK